MIKYFICDVDGVLTDGGHYYTKDGKKFKRFGSNDRDALKLLESKGVKILFLTGDSTGEGYAISKKRVEDMGFVLFPVQSNERLDWIKSKKYNFEEVCYMGDGIFDSDVFKEVKLGIAPANATAVAKESADFLTPNSGGNNAIVDAVFYLLSLS